MKRPRNARGAAKVSRSRASASIAVGRTRQIRRQKSPQFLLGARRRGAVIGEMHPQNHSAASGGGIVEQMFSARQDDQSRPGGAGRLCGDERPAIRRRRHRIGRADENEGRNRQRLALAVGARRVIAGGGAQAHARRRRGGERESDVGALREADDGDAPRVDERLTREKGQRRRRVSRADGKFDRAGLLSPRGANSST